MTTMLSVTMTAAATMTNQRKLQYTPFLCAFLLQFNIYYFLVVYVEKRKRWSAWSVTLFNRQWRQRRRWQCGLQIINSQFFVAFSPSLMFALKRIATALVSNNVVSGSATSSSPRRFECKSNFLHSLLSVECRLGYVFNLYVNAIVLDTLFSDAFAAQFLHFQCVLLKKSSKINRNIQNEKQ